MTAVADEDSKLLILVTLTSYFLANIPRPILVFHGEQGSGKSTLSSFIKKIVDPSLVDTTGVSRDVEGLIQLLAHHQCLCLDNISKLPQSFQDTLSRAVTGGAHSKRKLYTNEEDVVFSFKRSVVLNGINVAATRPDLLDRCILIHMERLSKKEKNKKHQQLIKEFDSALPKILGGIFNTLSAAMKLKKEISLERLPRLADFCELGYAISEVLGYFVR